MICTIGDVACRKTLRFLFILGFYEEGKHYSHTWLRAIQFKNALYLKNKIRLMARM